MSKYDHFIGSFPKRAADMGLLMHLSGEQSVVITTVRSGMVEAAGQIAAQRKGGL